MLNALVAKAAGAARVVVSDINTERLERALALGATDVVDPRSRSVPRWVADETAGRGVDAVVVAVPLAALQQEAVHVLAPFGRLCLFAGLPRGQGGVELDTNAIHYKNLIVTGMTGGSADDYRAALELVRTGQVDVAPLVSHVFPFGQMQQAYDAALSGQGLKVVIARDAAAAGGAL